MIKNIQLSIPEPCHQNWQQMTPQEQGRFCKACAKVVVDFSVMTDKEVLNYFSTVGGTTCGRLDQGQLDREIIYPHPPKSSWKKYWLSLATALIFFSAKLTAQTKPPKTTTAATPPSYDNKKGQVFITLGKVASSANQLPKTREVKGRVTDDNNTPIAGASVIVKGTGIGVAANGNGEFSINMAADKDNYLLFSAVGFEMKEFKWNNDVNKDSLLRIVLPTRQYMGEVGVIVVAEKKKRNLFDIWKKNEQKCTKVSQNMTIRIYPSLVAVGSSFNINLAGILPGNYSIFIYDASGRIILRREIHINKGAAVKESFPCDERFRGGMYLAEISGVGKTYRQQFAVQ
jgi:CarboxypepD_reg-like domain